MSMQQALSQIGITKEDYETLIKARNIANNGYTAEIKKDVKNNRLKVYEVKKEKR